MTEIAAIDWFGRWGTSVSFENTAIFKHVKEQFLNKAIRDISLKVLMKTLTFGNLNESCSPPLPTMSL